MNAYNRRLAILVEDLINTYDLFLDEPEHLRNPADLQAFLQAHGIQSGTMLTLALLDEVHSLRNRLRACWTAPSRDEMRTMLNSLLGQTAVIVQLGADPDSFLEFALPPAESLMDQLTVESALGIAVVLQEYGLERMRACAADPCRDVFVDVSRNNTRRFCSDRCANRYNIAAFRDRQKKNDEA